MLVNIKALGFPLTEAIRDHVANRIGSALDPFTPDAMKVTVRLDDINAARGGVDKRCSIIVALRGKGVVAATSIHEDLYVAASEAATRIRRSVKRFHRRRLTARRRPLRGRRALVVS